MLTRFLLLGSLVVTLRFGQTSSHFACLIGSYSSPYCSFIPQIAVTAFALRQLASQQIIFEKNNKKNVFRGSFPQQQIHTVNSCGLKTASVLERGPIAPSGGPNLTLKRHVGNLNNFFSRIEYFHKTFLIKLTKTNSLGIFSTPNKVKIIYAVLNIKHQNCLNLFLLAGWRKTTCFLQASAQIRLDIWPLFLSGIIELILGD